MSTANKLSYLNTTKTMLRDSLNKFGSNILSTDTFRSYDTKLNEIYDKLPKVTGSGSEFTLTPVQNGQVDDFKMIGTDLEQDTTTGKNLFDKDNANIITAYIGDSYNWVFSGSAICYRINCKPNTSYTISCANSNETIFRGSVTDSEDIPTNGNNLSIYSTVRRTNNSPITVNTGVNAKYVLVQLSNTQYLTSLETLQVEEGSSSTDWEPYTGGIASPNPDYPQQIKVVEGRQVITNKGKNLFDVNQTPHSNSLPGVGVITTINNDGTISTSGTNSETYRNIRYDIQLPAGEYIISGCPAGGSKNGYSSLVQLTEETSSQIFDTGNGASFTLTETTTVKFYPVRVGSETVNFNGLIFKPMIMLANLSDDTFEPYYNQVSYNIDLHGKNCFDGQYEDGYYNNSNGTKNSIQDPYGRRSTNKNEVKPNENYIISVNNVVTNLSIRLFYYDINRNFLSTDTTTTGIFTTPNDCYFIAWHSSSLKQNYPDGIPNMMIEQGQTVTTYEDYYDYKLAKIPNTDYKNRIYKNNGNWYFEKNIKKIDSYNGETITTSYMSTTGQLTTGATIYYALATPVTTQITNTTLINQLEAISVHTGTNIITLSSDNNMTPQIEITRLKELEKLS